MSAELWILSAFVLFCGLFGHKIWKHIIHLIDAHIDSVKKALDEAEKAKSDADIMLREVTQRKRDVDHMIAEHRSASEKRLQEMKQAHEDAIAEIKLRYQEDLQRQMQRNLDDYKQQLFERASEMIRTAVIDRLKTGEIVAPEEALIKSLKEHLQA